MLSQDFINEVKERNDITEVISGYVSLKRTGRNSKGLCPFHSEKTPSFMVYPDTASFYCFGCQVGGDVIGFIRKIENLDYVEAVKFLANRAGLAVPEDGKNDGLTRMRQRIREQNREAGRFFYRALREHNNPGYTYMRRRGISDETLNTFGIGYADDGWTTLTDHLVKEDKNNEPEDRNDHCINSSQYAWLPYKTKIGCE